MIFYKTLYIILICFGFLINAQIQNAPVMIKDEFGNEYYYDSKLHAKVYEIEGEKNIIFDELELQSKPKFNNQLDKNYYFFLNKKLNVVYPLFITALQQYQTLNTDIQNMDKREKRKFIKLKQKELSKQYETQLRNLTTTEGLIFIKLMNRATGKTVFEIIKELRGGFNAFIWNVKGNIADVELKREYNPRKYREDEYLESLLKSNWRLGYLKPYKGYENYTAR